MVSSLMFFLQIANLIMFCELCISPPRSCSKTPQSASHNGEKTSAVQKPRRSVIKLFLVVWGMMVSVLVWKFCLDF